MQITAQNEVERQIVRVMQEMTEVLIMKNRDYKSASFAQGVVGNVVHLDDKIARYKNLVYGSLRSGIKPYNEGVLDTIRDIVGYGVLGILVFEMDKRNGLDFLGFKVRPNAKRQ